MSKENELFEIENGVLVKVKNKDITEAVIPNGTKIEVGAFTNCSPSFSFYTPEGEKTEIENICIKEDWFLGTIKDVSEVSIPQGVTGIAADAFCLCKTLEKVIIPEGVTIIGEGAFFGCESLKKIVLPNSLTEVVSEAFEGCSSLESVIIPPNVKVEKNAFTGCRPSLSFYTPNSFC